MPRQATLDNVILQLAQDQSAEAQCWYGKILSAGPQAYGLSAGKEVLVDNRGGAPLKVEEPGFPPNGAATVYVVKASQVAVIGYGS